MRETPTAEGLRRYPHTQGFFPDLSQTETAPDLALPCTCQPGCALRCAGECRCKACEMAFVEFADVAGCYVDGELDEELALQRYRGG